MVAPSGKIKLLVSIAQRLHQRSPLSRVPYNPGPPIPPPKKKQQTSSDVYLRVENCSMSIILFSESG